MLTVDERSSCRSASAVGKRHSSASDEDANESAMRLAGIVGKMTCACAFLAA